LLDDPKTTDLARLALQTLPGQRATDALLAALDRLQGVPLAGIVNSLGVRREAVAVPKLTALLGNAELVVHNAALHALASIGSFDSSVALVASNYPARNQAAWFDAQLLAAANLTSTQRTLAFSLCEHLWNSQNPASPKSAALAGLVHSKPGEALTRLLMKALLEGLVASDPEVRGTAAVLVAELEDPARLSQVAAALPQFSPDTQALICDAFAANDDRTLLAAVLPLVSSSNEVTRLAAISAMGRLGGVANVDALLQLAASDPVNMRNAARKALSILSGADVDPRLIALAGAGANDLRVEAIRALAARNAKAVPTLFNLAADPDATVQRAAVEALGSLVTPADYPRLVSVLVAQAGKPASQAAVAAVVAAGKRVPDRAQRVQPAVTAFPAASPVAKAALLEVLGSFGGSEALAVVAGALKDGDSSVRDVALETLAEWPDASAAKPLLAAAQAADSDATRAKAWGAYVRLALEAKDQAAPLLQQASAAAKTSADRQALLAALAKADKPAALAAATALLSDPALADDAGTVALALARKFAKTDSDAAVTAAERVTQVAKDPALVAQAREFLAKQGTAAQALDSAPYGKDVIAARQKQIAAQLPAGDTLLAYLDAGVETQSAGTSGPVIRQLNGRAWHFSESGKAAPAQTVAFDGRRLTFELAAWTQRSSTPPCSRGPTPTAAGAPPAWISSTAPPSRPGPR
jgi:HEAT repeat protein